MESRVLAPERDVGVAALERHLKAREGGTQERLDVRIHIDAFRQRERDAAIHEHDRAEALGRGRGELEGDVRTQ